MAGNFSFIEPIQAFRVGDLRAVDDSTMRADSLATDVWPGSFDQSSTLLPQRGAILRRRYTVSLRLLGKERFALDRLGLDDESQRRFRKLLATPNGIVLLTGPTGCGKSTTIYTLLSSLNTQVRLIVTIEDPVEVAIRGALTGHLVFSTLHTNDAIGGITRLIDMGIERFLVADSVRAFISQRLVRVLCPH